MQFKDEIGPGRSERDPIDWAARKAELIENEGKWGLIAANVASSTPFQLRTGRNKNFRGEELDHFEFAGRKPEDPEVAASYAPRRSDVWGRYTA